MTRRRFEAERVGVLVSDLARRGTIASLYDRAANILTEEGLLLSLVASLDQMSSLSIQLPALAKDHPVLPGGHGIHLEEGAPARLGAMRLIVQGSIIDLHKARPWSGEPVLPDDQAFTIHRVKLLEGVLLACGREGGLLGVLVPGCACNRYAARARAILGSVSTMGTPHRQGRPIPSGLSGLIGLGPGFTPSGDDFLSGIFLGERIHFAAAGQGSITDRKREGLRELRLEKARLLSRLDRTTPGGRTLLWQALRGHFPAYLLDAARGVAAASSAEQMRSAVERAVAHGETSGTDALAGFLWFFKHAFGAP